MLQAGCRISESHRYLAEFRKGHRKLKSKISLPPWLREASYSVLPNRRRIASLLEEIRALSMGASDVNSLVASAVIVGKAFSYVRPGGTESEGLYTFMKYRLLRNKFLSDIPYSYFFKDAITPFSGVGYNSRRDLDYFCYRYMEATLSSNVMGYGRFAPGALGIARLRAEIGLPIAQFEVLEPIRAMLSDIQPWTGSLSGKKVLVVHPFAKTIEAQFLRKNQISGVKDVLPDFELAVMRPPISVQPGLGDFDSWPFQFRQLVSATLERDFDVALIGAGGYGAPLAHAVKSSGKTAIHTAGATQLMFGICGKRWDTDSEMAKIMDSTWIRPFEEDLSPEIKTMDGSGAYH